MFWRNRVLVEGIPVNQANLDYHKARTLKDLPQASAFGSTLYWSGQGSRSNWLITSTPHTGSPFITAATEEWVWERASNIIAVTRMINALQTIQNWVDKTPDLPELPWKGQLREALEISKLDYVDIPKPR